MATIRQVAEACGVSKPFVSKIVRDLDPGGDHQRTVGNRIEIDEWLAGAAAHEAVRRKSRMAAHDEAVGVVLSASSEAQADAEARFEAEVDRLRERYDDLLAEKDARIADLRDQAERLRVDRDAEVTSLREQLADRDAEVARLRDYARRLEHAHWWQKRSVIESFGLLPEPRG